MWGLRWGYRVHDALKEGDGWMYEVGFYEEVEVDCGLWVVWALTGDLISMSMEGLKEVVLHLGRGGQMSVCRSQWVGIGCMLMVTLEWIG